MKPNLGQYKLAAKFGILAAFFFSTYVDGAQFSVNPVRVYLDGKSKSGSLVVENTSDEVVTIQAMLNSWTQDKGVDKIDPTEDLLVSPPIFKVQPKSKQVVRVGFLKAPDATREGSYRLFLQEVPPPRKPDEQGMGVSLRMSLPIFVAPNAGNHQAALKWTAQPVDDNNLKLSIANSGNAHIQITAISVSLPDGSYLAGSPSMMTYILPGQLHTWDFKTDHPWKSGALRVTVKSDAAAPGVETEVKPE
ncbi:MAG: fimbria/pilus periplasmic chaperone [Nitrosomonadales bacterium]